MHTDGNLDDIQTAHFHHHTPAEYDEMAAAADSSGSGMFLDLFHLSGLHISDEQTRCTA